MPLDRPDGTDSPNADDAPEPDSPLGPDHRPASADPEAFDVEGLLAVLRRAEALKDETRTAWTSEGRRESVAAHTWRLCLWATVLGDHFGAVDTGRLLQLCVVHDLGEALQGDVPAPQQAGAEHDGDKVGRERADLQTLLAPLPAPDRKRLVALWEEYEAAATPEARLAKALDKLETILQHNQGANPPDFDYRFNLDYGAEYTERPPLIAAIRAVLDRETEARAEAPSASEAPSADEESSGAPGGATP
jgi:putative hydrolase of HD superfamily